MVVEQTVKRKQEKNLAFITSRTDGRKVGSASRDDAALSRIIGCWLVISPSVGSAGERRIEASCA